MGSRSSLSRENTESVDHWEMNYHEAAIFLEVKSLFLELYMFRGVEHLSTEVAMKFRTSTSLVDVLVLKSEVMST